MDKIMTKSERQELLEAFKGLRLTDVRDGLDWNNMHHYASMSTDIRPIWRTSSIGIAKTVRYLPWQGPLPAMTPEEYDKWFVWYYREVCQDRHWMIDVEEGDFVVMDQGNTDVAHMGSNNTLVGVSNGVVGYVTNGGIRDTDEVILQKIPAWSRMVSKTMVQGRLQYDAKDVPVCVGGVVVYPGDVVVADGDGVVVVPRQMAFSVAKWGRKEAVNDRKSRKGTYEKMGKELDDSVK